MCVSSGFRDGQLIEPYSKLAVALLEDEELFRVRHKEMLYENQYLEVVEVSVVGNHLLPFPLEREKKAFVFAVVRRPVGDNYRIYIKIYRNYRRSWDRFYS